MNMESENALEKTIITIENSKKKEHPQRDLMKKVCKTIFYLGGGSFWYEESKLSSLQQMLYNIYAVIFNIYIFGNFFNEILAYFFGDLTTKEENDLIQFSIAHSHVLLKFVMVYLSRKRVKIFLKRILEEDREFAILEIDQNSVKIAKRYCMMLIMTLFFCLFSATVDGIKVHIKQGKLDFVTYESGQKAFSKISKEPSIYSTSKSMAAKSDLVTNTDKLI